MTIDFSSLVVDMDNDVTSIVITKMPTKGKLYYADGEEIVHEFRLDAMQPVYEQYITSVLNVSTHYAFGDPVRFQSNLCATNCLYVHNFTLCLL